MSPESATDKPAIRLQHISISVIAIAAVVLGIAIVIVAFAKKDF